MFGLDFLFAAALWALPLASLPLLLHLLFRQKLPVVQFSTLRFIQSSVRRNAARRKIERWALLACRALLLLLLIWALAQPARKLASGWLGGSGGTSIAAAIVVDTSYSMLLEDQQATGNPSRRALLDKANDAAADLLRTELRDANVAIFTSHDTESPRLQPAEALRGEHWAALRPTPSDGPLMDRIDAAAKMLADAGEDHKWLIVLTDSQAKEFPRPLPSAPAGSQNAGVREMLIDLHPADVRAAAITGVGVDPKEPRLGIPAQVVVEAAGKANDTREVAVDVSSAGEAEMQRPPPQPSPAEAEEGVMPGGKNSLSVMPLSVSSPLPSSARLSPLPLAHFDAGGRAELRSPLNVTQPNWTVLTARLSNTEALPWASQRSELVRVPPRAEAAVLEVGRPNPQVARMIRLALDPSEGQQSAWPIVVRDGEPKWDEVLIVVILNEWPDEATVKKMAEAAGRGASLVVFVQPGLEESWPGLDPGRQAELAVLLPSAPMTAGAAMVPVVNGVDGELSYHAAIMRPGDPVMAGIGDARGAEARLVVTRLMRFVNGDPSVTAIINAEPNSAETAAKPSGILWRRTVGAGQVYTWATMPDRSCGNLRVWEVFPPALVNSAGLPTGSGNRVNIDLGEPAVWRAADVPADFPAGAEVDIRPPSGQAMKVSRVTIGGGDRYIFTDTNSPGLYEWEWNAVGGKTGVLGWTNVQVPAGEADLRYRTTDELVAGNPNVTAGHSLDEVRRKLSQLDEPTPQWTWPIALVLLLLCVEGFLGAKPKWASRAGKAGSGSGRAAYLADANNR